MTTKFRMTCILAKEDMPPVVQLICDRVSQLSFEEIGRGGDHPRKRTYHERHRGGEGTKPAGSANKTESDLNAWQRPPGKAILALMKKGGKEEYHYSELLPAIRELGMADASISPLVSNLYHSKHIVRTKLGYYRLS